MQEDAAAVTALWQTLRFSKTKVKQNMYTQNKNGNEYEFYVQMQYTLY
jgi:hypothetical protein